MLMIRKVRIERGWTQAEVCRRTGLDQATISKLERGIYPSYPGWRRRLSRLFKMPADLLFAPAEHEATGKE